MILKKYVHPKIDNIRLLNECARASLKASRIHRKGWLWCFKRVLSLVDKYRFAPFEALKWGLFNPNITDSELKNFVSKRALSRFQNSINPDDWYYVTEDKSIFYRFCEAEGIPVPELFGVLYRNYPHWIRFQETNNIEHTSVDPSKYLVVKPCRSVFGQGVFIYDDIELGQGCEISDRNKKLEEIASKVFSETRFNSFVVQEKLRNHSKLRTLGDNEELKTVRVITYLDKEHRPQILATFLKVATGENITDNWDGGASGNLIIHLDEMTGRADEVIRQNDPTGVAERITWEDLVQSEQGYLEEFFYAPLWDEVRALAHRLARSFSPLRIIGWDIAITDKGVFALEGNYRAGPYPSALFRKLLESAAIDINMSVNSELRRAANFN